jgi:hypothetical protein
MIQQQLKVVAKALGIGILVAVVAAGCFHEGNSNPSNDSQTENKELVYGQEGEGRIAITIQTTTAVGVVAGFRVEVRTELGQFVRETYLELGPTAASGFVSGVMVVQTGDFVVQALPMSSYGVRSDRCSPSNPVPVIVYPGVTAEASLVSVCSGLPSGYGTSDGYGAPSGYVTPGGYGVPGCGEPVESGAGSCNPSYGSGHPAGGYATVNQRPVIEGIYAPECLRVCETAQLTVNAMDADGDPLTFQFQVQNPNPSPCTGQVPGTWGTYGTWSQGGCEPLSYQTYGNALSFRAGTPGQYRVVVYACDPQGACDQAERTLTVR